MSSSQPTELEGSPCAAKPSDHTARYLHPEGPCACFHGGPAPVRVLLPEFAMLADRPGVFDTTAVGRPTPRTTGSRLRAWLRSLFKG